MNTDAMRGVYRAFSTLGLLAFLALVAGYQVGRVLALKDNRQTAQGARGVSCSRPLPSKSNHGDPASIASEMLAGFQAHSPVRNRSVSPLRKLRRI